MLHFQHGSTPDSINKDETFIALDEDRDGSISIMEMIDDSIH